MVDYRKGDLVRISFETEVTGIGADVILTDELGRVSTLGPDKSGYTVELIKRANDPANDPVGTWRQWTSVDGSNVQVYCKVREGRWMLVSSNTVDGINMRYGVDDVNMRYTFRV